MLGRAAPWLCALLFFALAMPFLDRPGIYNDEALFGNATFAPYTVVYSAQAFKAEMPLMLMTYVGTLKAYLAKFIFLWADPSAANIRLLPVLLGAVTVAVFFMAVRRLLGERAAWLATLLLATDTTFIITTRYDWGPVALQHLLLVAGVAALVRFVQQGELWALAAGFFCFGLGLWDKALFIWSLAALGVAMLVTAWPTVRRLVTWRHAAVALVAFGLGAYPLLRYNISRQWATFRGNTVWSTADLPGKVNGLRRALDGSALFGWLAREAEPGERPPAGRAEAASIALSRQLGEPQRGLFLWLFLLMLPASFFFWRTPVARVLLFCWIAFAITWILMLFNRDTGASVHHVVLLWPWPQVIAAVVCSRWGRAGMGLVMVVALSGVAVTNQYYSQLIRYGGGHGWSDAVSGLAQHSALRQAGQVYALDWGMIESLHLLQRGTVKLGYLDQPAIQQAAAAVEGLIHRPDVVFVRYTPGNEFIAGVPEALDGFAAARGARHFVLATVPDSNGRPIFEIFRYQSTAH
jgi:4-amino-4-deoxy-L-arabinose transferase-like glycosyltransferase